MIDSENNIIKINQLIFNNSLLKTIKDIQYSGKKVYLIGPIQTQNMEIILPLT